MVAYRWATGINKLEKAVLQSAVAAQMKYRAMTGGWWLWHGPESFLQVVIAQGLAKTIENAVYIDTSMGQMEDEKGRGPGRPAADDGRRPDLSVWYKTSDRLRAVIEIKRTTALRPIAADAKKIEGWLTHRNALTVGYILGYSEAKGKKRTTTLEKRFDKWEAETGWQRRGSVVYDDPDDPEWGWGVVLIRKDKS